LIGKGRYEMISNADKKECCGCTACASICPKQCISMEADIEGFLYPVVDNRKCVDCKLCENVCPFLNRKRPEHDLEETFAAINRDDDLRMHSSSGGIFVALANRILEDNGVVFGAAYDEKWCVYHKSAESKRELLELTGSKYMQSVLNDTYHQVEEKLLQGREVLFVGTTCQVNGLKNYLRKEYSNLICVDFICLGVPSPLVWKDYLDTYFKDYHINSVNFKEKSSGWHSFSLNIEGENEHFCKVGRKTIFFTGYFRHLYTRPSCSNCIYKTGNRVSDITLADCWGYHIIAPEMDDNKGMSSVICHSRKGLDLFNDIKANLIWKDAKLDDVLEFNSGYRKSSVESEKRQEFWRDYYLMDKEKLFEKYCTPQEDGIITKIKTKVKHILSKTNQTK
jgi:coenzyme F420-reducing hydrogenase beta subunit